MLPTNDLISYIEKVVSHEFVTGGLFATAIIALYHQGRKWFVNKNKKDEKLYVQCDEVYKLTKETLTEIPKTLDNIVSKLDNIISTINTIATTVNVVDRNTSQDRFVGYANTINQQLIELAKLITDLKAQVQVLENKILEKLKAIEGADYDV